MAQADDMADGRNEAEDTAPPRVTPVRVSRADAEAIDAYLARRAAGGEVGLALRSTEDQASSRMEKVSGLFQLLGQMPAEEPQADRSKTGISRLKAIRKTAAAATI